MEFHPPANPTSEVIPHNDVIPTKHPWSTSAPIRKQLNFLTQEQVDQFDRDGLLVIRREQVWSEDEFKLLLESVNMMNDWPDQKGKWMKYYEKPKPNQENRLLCRIENFTQYNPGLNFLLNGQKLIGMMSDLFGEKAILYKEKINYKLPGGEGFAPHQDVAAGWWMYGQSLHISTLVCIDEATEENGCLELVYGKHKEGMLCDPWKEIPESTCDTLDWKSAPTRPGDIVFFDSYVPHRSGPNNSQKPRRVLYATYAKEAEGDLRDRYYMDKRASYPPDIEREAGKVYEYKI